MKVRVKLFAVARELAGRDTVEIALSVRPTVGQLRDALAAQVPELAGLVRHVTFAIGADYADDRATIDEGSDVACIPPVSGG
jgi:molybdopterin synthase sulfur carrier subunit